MTSHLIFMTREPYLLDNTRINVGLYALTSEYRVALMAFLVGTSPADV